MTVDNTDPSRDLIADFYERHPYPPPVGLDRVRLPGAPERRARHHLIWPNRSPRDSFPDGRCRTLIAGCGTTQAARHAMVNPEAEVVGIDVSSASLGKTRDLIRQHGIDNLTLHQLPIERVSELDQQFDRIISTGVLHCLADPTTGLRALHSVLAPGGAVTIMLYARYGRAGVYMMQEYCRRLGLSGSVDDLAELAKVVTALDPSHPLRHLMQNSWDFDDPDALADVLLNPRDRPYTVTETLTFLSDGGFRFGRWQRQAPYLPDCGAVASTPHAARIAALPRDEQFAAVELFRGTIASHTAIAYAANDDTVSQPDLDDDAVSEWRPLIAPTTRIATAGDSTRAGRPGAVLRNAAHAESDLALPVTDAEFAVVRRIDGTATVGDLVGDNVDLIRRLFRHDLIVLDTTPAT
ncbi:Methyltransferase domain-containing protein [Microlunatus soli]|uniref:Methyltransferase domain-containing protein n=2 Tax=Microlunatus soli TaxID=630515 RepID=A0A1H1YUZ4_9ACTN|nr:Methyltransferase domain-containing protein [Microlunatus soli]